MARAECLAPEGSHSPREEVVGITDLAARVTSLQGVFRLELGALSRLGQLVDPFTALQGDLGGGERSMGGPGVTSSPCVLSTFPDFNSESPMSWETLWSQANQDGRSPPPGEERNKHNNDKSKDVSQGGWFSLLHQVPERCPFSPG